jgi:FHS family L-fucose permease-like MFS transporter
MPAFWEPPLFKSLKNIPLFRTADGRNYLPTFLLIASLFLLWGFCNGMIDVMDKHFQDKLHLTRAQSAWVQFAHYLGYFLIALPAGWVARRLGYKGGILTGLGVVAAAGFWFVPATFIDTFWAFLLGVCLLAMGLTFLETVANPYATVLGHRDTAATRINLAQSFNGVGWVLGPWVGGLFFYGGTVQENHERLYIPYLGVGVVVLLLFVIFAFVRLPNLETEDLYAEESADAPKASLWSIWKHGHFVGGVLSQFLYVAAQAGIFSFFINYMVADTPPATGWSWTWLVGGAAGFHEQADGLRFISEMGATKLLSYAFVLFLVGRVVGAALMKIFPSHQVLGAFAVLNIGMMVLILLKLGWVSVAALFLSFFFMSIMFPTIFALGIHGLGTRAKLASSFLVMAIMGGAIMPKLMGWMSDHFGHVEGHYGRIVEATGHANQNLMSPGFAVPLVSFLVIAVYGFCWKRLCKDSE